MATSFCLFLVVGSLLSAEFCPGLIGRVHKSVDGSLCPLSMIFFLKYTLHFLSSNTTLHPALHNTRIPNKEATARLGTMCPLSVVGSPWIMMSHTCVDFTCLPFGRFIVNGFFAGRLFLGQCLIHAAILGL